MIMHRGPNRASFMWGSSTRNTRIEHLWVEVGTQFARRWRAFFTRLGRLHSLDRKNPYHLWLLHRLFLSDINADCVEFQAQWNAHPIAGRETKNRSPADLRFLGQTTQGIYTEDTLEDIHPDTLDRYYSTHGPEQQRHPNATGAGHPVDEREDEHDESDSESDDTEPEDELEGLAEQIAVDQARNIRHKPIKVARSHNPFDTAEGEQKLHKILQDVAFHGIQPPNYGILPSEWDDEFYPEEETIKFGTRGTQLKITLPVDIWYPRAVQWAQALDVMSRILLDDEAKDDE
ncbi:hypothetical protein OE88DRAFT_1776280 [Heliocybe sulcata]|uniref:Integrase core domain-containing protein n=1 Tax=Heliocybe sulcata TaxID=5364 RepID=A0A5C3MS43_9AGAM|nr:hypothetical protein OE88DRAFT_1776280 [Heliocybe sulcata]